MTNKNRKLNKSQKIKVIGKNTICKN